MKHHVDTLVRFFETLTPAQVERLADLYTADAQFKDPFNAVQGLAAVQQVYRHMYDSLDAPHFIVTNRIVDGNQCFLTWEFKFSFRNFHKGVQQTVVGGSHLVLADDGRIQLHRDYWDAAEELYEKLPVVGSLMRWLKKRAND
jgi:limonene-1,2-epoxide hydrolase